MKPEDSEENVPQKKIRLKAYKIVIGILLVILIICTIAFFCIGPKNIEDDPILKVKIDEIADRLQISGYVKDDDAEKVLMAFKQLESIPKIVYKNFRNPLPENIQIDDRL